MTDSLFPEMEPTASEREEAPRKEPPRLLRADRRQVQLRPMDLESLLPEDHKARVVWAFVEGMDLERLYAGIGSVSGRAGRPAIDPAILMGLWLYATLDGVGSARQLARLCKESDPYRWICGGVNVNHHTLSDFRVGYESFLDETLTNSVAVLMHAGAVKLKRVAQDGVRVRASAGAGSFRRKKRLKECLAEAENQVEALKKELDGDPAGSSRRAQAAALQAAEQRARRVKEALKQLPKVEETKKRNRKKSPKRAAAASDEDDKKHAPRVSTTDPDARVMKMGDNGFRPAFNGQFATDADSQVIVGVDATNEGSDARQLVPMLEQIDRRYGRTPEEMLVDGGYGTLKAIEAAPTGCTVYAPLPPAKDRTRDPYQPLPGDSPKVAEWRERMGTAAGKEIYRERAATAECVNAIARNRGLQRFLVRGLSKVRCVLLWYALAHNLMRQRQLLAPAAA